MAPTSFTDALNISINISFSEPCNGGGGFRCSSVNTCNLLAYDGAQVVPDTLTVLQPNIKFSLLVNLPSTLQYGRVVLVMDTSFCTDAAGNKFTRTMNSSFVVHVDRRHIFADLRTHVPEHRLQLNSQTRTVLATNKHWKLKVYLYFSHPILNSSTEILKLFKVSQGSLAPISGSSHGNRRFGFQVENITSFAILTVSVSFDFIRSREGMRVSPTAPITFLYDSQRFNVMLSANHMRTREKTIPILINFSKPVFSFNVSHIDIFGGHLISFHKISRRTYVVGIQASDCFISINVPENVTTDVAGNKNLASNILRVRHYSIPVVSLVLSTFTAGAFAATCFAAGLLTISTASLHSVATLSKPPSLRSDPARNLFRIACHIQIFALSKWLSVNLPVEYYEFTKDLQWSIPYIYLPWKTEEARPSLLEPSSPTNPQQYDLGNFEGVQLGENLDMAASVYALPLTPMEYQLFFENATVIPKARYLLDPHSSNGWREFYRCMFWLAVIGGSLILLHALVIFILKFRRKNSEKSSYGALVFPRFEIFLVILSLPCLCKSSMALMKGGSSAGTILGIFLLIMISFLLLALLLFLSIGITFGKLLQYKEVHREGLIFHWYQDIVRVTLGPGKRGQWTWKGQSNVKALNKFGPLFEDLRGPPKYMLSQIAEGNPRRRSDRIIASDDETEDAEAPFIQKLFGILRIYFTLLESVRRACLGIIAGFYTENSSSKAPTVIILSITSFELFFIVLKKPFIKKRVQLVEIISVTVEVGIFLTCFALLNKELSPVGQTKVGIFMLSLFLIAFLAQMINEWYALYRQTKLMDPARESFLSGLKMASVGILLLFLPRSLIQKLDSKFPWKKTGETGDATSSGDRNRSSGSGSRSSGDKQWAKQAARGASDAPSTSQWSGFWSEKRSASSSTTPASESKSKARGLYKDLEAIFASK